MGNIKPLLMPHFGIWPRDTLGLPLWASDERFSWLDVNFNAWGGRFTAKGYEVDGDLWPATGFVDTEIKGVNGTGEQGRNDEGSAASSRLCSRPLQVQVVARVSALSGSRQGAYLDQIVQIARGGGA